LRGFCYNYTIMAVRPIDPDKIERGDILLVHTKRSFISFLIRKFTKSYWNSKLHDHKGTLMVSWKEQPTDGEKEMFVKAWKSRIGDGAPNVEHEIETPNK